MLKIVCLALGHRLRVVQEFTPYCRRVKCVRCGGDWGMNDDVRVLIDWSPSLEQHHRDMGSEILEPLRAWRSLPVEPLTWGEWFRACRWPGALVITLSQIVGLTITVIAGGSYLGPIAAIVISWALGRFLAQPAIDRAYERKCNSLEA